MAKKSTPYCLVLAGGGAKGVYHIGVWRALREMKIEVNAFIGNSIGAIISGFLAQGATEKLEEIGEQIGLDFVVEMPDEFIEAGEFKLTSTKQLSGFRKFFQSAIDKKGLDTGPLQRVLRANLDEEKIRKSGNDLGIVTYNLTDMEPEEIFIEDMQQGELINYLLASAAFPGFEKPEIAGKRYIDGGVYDNIPYSMAQKRGYKRMIVVDVSGLGIKRKLDVKGGQIIYIKNSIKMGGVLDFNREFIDNFTKLGYLDTMRTFDRLSGYHYFMVPHPRTEKKFNDFITTNEYSLKLHEYTQRLLGEPPQSFSLALKTVFPDYARYERDWLPVFADCTAAILAIERIQKYEYKELFEEIDIRYQEVLDKVEQISTRGVKYIETLIKKRISERKFIEEPYYYYLLIEQFLPQRAKKLLMKGLVMFFPELEAGHFFISELQTFWRE